MLRAVSLCVLVCLAACKPPASEEYSARGDVVEGPTAPSPPIDSPNTEGAVWALSSASGRLLYGKPGEQPLFSLSCEEGTLVFTRYAAADAEAKGVLALIGNGHVERLWIDAEKQGTNDGAPWLWRGRIAANDQRLEVLTGPRRIEATVPGAGTLVLNPSTAPADYITRCATLIAQPPAQPEGQA